MCHGATLSATNPNALPWEWTCISAAGIRRLITWAEGKRAVQTRRVSYWLHRGPFFLYLCNFDDLSFKSDSTHKVFTTFSFTVRLLKWNVVPVTYRSIVKHVGITVKSAHILNLGSCLRWAVNFKRSPLFRARKEPPVSLAQKAGWASEPVWTRWRREKELP